jgi:hypothetical protein
MGQWGEEQVHGKGGNPEDRDRREEDSPRWIGRNKPCGQNRWHQSPEARVKRGRERSQLHRPRAERAEREGKNGRKERKERTEGRWRL